MRPFVLLLLLFVPCLLKAQKSTISGYVKEAASGESLIGASVYVKELKTGNVTNTYGFYSLTLPLGNYTLVFSSSGFKKIEKEIQVLAKAQEISVELTTDSKELAEVIVKARSNDENVKGIEMSVNKVDIKTIRKIPALLGEVDLVRAIQLLPGVSTVGEGASGFNVRGGGVDQNLVLLDDAPVYNSSHLFGFFSVFNPDAVKDVKLFKGGISQAIDWAKARTFARPNASAGSSGRSGWTSSRYSMMAMDWLRCSPSTTKLGTRLSAATLL